MPSERLTLPKKGIAPADGRSEFRRLGFDETRMNTATVTTFVATPDFAFAIFTVPKNVERAVVRELVITGDPEGYFLNHVAWTLKVDHGPIPEFLPRNNNVQDVVGNLNNGFRFGPCGSLARPRRVHIELHQEQVLQVHVVLEGTTINQVQNVYSRVVGVSYVRSH